MGDLISRQVAIDALRVAYWDDNIQSAKDDPCIVDAMTDWAIRQVKALPSTQPERKTEEFVKLTVRDSNGRPYYSIIYLEDGNEFEGYSSYSLDVISDYLKRYFEFAQLERKMGRWIDDHCSECGQYVFHEDVRNFCPNCGAKMLKEGEE